MKKPTFNVLNLWGALIKPSFYSYIVKEKPVRKLWGFWFLWNTVAALALTIGLGIFFNTLSQDFEEEIWPQIPEFEFVFENYELTSTGLEDPFRYDFDDDEGEFSFIIDLEGDQYDESSLGVLDNAILINKDTIMIQDDGSLNTDTIIFANIPQLENQSFGKTDVQTLSQQYIPRIKMFIALFMFLTIWFFYCIIRLIGVVIYAFLGWIVSLILKLPNTSFENIFLLTLGLSFIPLVISLGLFASNIYIPFFTLILYTILFGMNFHDTLASQKKTPKKKS